MNKQTIRDIEITGKRVLVRVDYNVPVDSMGKVLDDFRIKASLPTLHYLLEHNCKLMLISHLGRPEVGKLKPGESLRSSAERLSELLKMPVEFRQDIEDSAPS